MSRQASLTLFRSDNIAAPLFQAVRRMLTAERRAGHRFLAVGGAGGSATGAFAAHTPADVKEIAAASVPDLLIVDARLAGLVSGMEARRRVVVSLGGRADPSALAADLVVVTALEERALLPAVVPAILAPLPLEEPTPELPGGPVRLQILADENADTLRLAACLLKVLAERAREDEGRSEAAREAAAEFVADASSRAVLEKVAAGLGLGDALSFVAERPHEPAALALDLRAGGSARVEADWADLIGRGTMPAAYHDGTGRSGSGADIEVAFADGVKASLCALMDTRYMARERVREASLALAGPADEARRLWARIYDGAHDLDGGGRPLWSAPLLTCLAASGDADVLSRVARLDDRAATWLDAATRQLRVGALQEALAAVKKAAARAEAEEGGAPPDVAPLQVTREVQGLWRAQRVAPGAAALNDLEAAHRFIDGLDIVPPDDIRQEDVPSGLRGDAPETAGAQQAAFGAALHFGLETATLARRGIAEEGVFWSPLGFTLVYGGNPADGLEAPQLVCEGRLVGEGKLVDLKVRWRGRDVVGTLAVVGNDFRLTAPLADPGMATGTSTGASDDDGTAGAVLIVTPRYHASGETIGLLVRKVAVESAPPPHLAGARSAHAVWLEALPRDAGLHPPERSQGQFVRWLASRTAFSLPPIIVDPARDVPWLVVTVHGATSSIPTHLLAEIEGTPTTLEAVSLSAKPAVFAAPLGDLIDWSAGGSVALDAPMVPQRLNDKDTREAKVLIGAITVELLARPRAADRPRRTEVPVEGPTRGNWHGVETAGGRPHRWLVNQGMLLSSGAARLGPGDIVTVQGSAFTHPGAVHKLTVTVNDLPVTRQNVRVDRNPARWVWRGVLSCDHEREVAGLRLELKSEAPRRIGPNDTRTGTVLVREISIERAGPIEAPVEIALKAEAPPQGAFLFEDMGGSFRGFWIGRQTHLGIAVPEGAARVTLLGPTATDPSTIENLTVASGEAGFVREEVRFEPDGAWSATFKVPGEGASGMLDLSVNGAPADTGPLLILRAVRFHPGASGGSGGGGGGEGA